MAPETPINPRDPGDPDLGPGDPNSSPGDPNLDPGDPNLGPGAPILTRETPILALETPILTPETPILTPETPILAQETQMGGMDRRTYGVKNIKFPPFIPLQNDPHYHSWLKGCQNPTETGIDMRILSLVRAWKVLQFAYRF